MFSHSHSGHNPALRFTRPVIHPVFLRCLWSGQPVVHVRISTSASSVSPQTVQVICTPQALNRSPALQHTLSPPLVVELPWATPWWQAIFEVALSRASGSRLYKKRAEEEEKEKYQPGICWSLSQFLSHLLKARLFQMQTCWTSPRPSITFFFWLQMYRYFYLEISW